MAYKERAPLGKTQINRITAMERRLVEAEAALRGLETALDGYEAALEGLRELEAYYDGGDWRRDFEADEEGLLPADLKRGVLSEDALYDLLTDRDALLRRMRDLTGETAI